MSPADMYEAPVSPCSSVVTDDENLDSRVFPEWSSYRTVIECRGYRLDTVRDVRAFYDHSVARNCQELPSKGFISLQPWMGYPSNDEDENNLCKDRGLVSSLESLNQTV